MPEILVMADDITGANDIGIMYAKAGLCTLVYSQSDEKEVEYKSSDVLILDTDSRFDSSETAYQKVYKALQRVKHDEICQYMNKQCSVFRGNIGAEFDAMLDALGEDFAAVVPGFPQNGRTTRHSRHYVYQTLLQESQFKNDPVHPMKESNLVTILKSQTRRRVTAIHYEVYDRGVEAVRQALQEARKSCHYCIMDVRDDRDLKLLAGLLKDERVICGSSALAEYLAQLYPKERNSKLSGKKRMSGKRNIPERQGAFGDKVFCIAGSLTPQTLAQTDYLKKQGYAVLELDTRKLLDRKGRQQEIERLLKLTDHAYQAESFVMIHSMQQQGQVAETKALFQEQGYDNTEVSSQISKTLAMLCATVVEKQKIGNVITCGGDTSAAICRQLKVDGMEILAEIETGLPLCISVTPPYYKMVLKSGSFGSEQFIEKAIESLHPKKECRNQYV